MCGVLSRIPFGDVRERYFRFMESNSVSQCNKASASYL